MARVNVLLLVGLGGGGDDDSSEPNLINSN